MFGTLLVSLVALDQSYTQFKRMLDVASWLPLLVTSTGFALLSMTTLIEVFVQSNVWPMRLSWTGLLLLLIDRGVGVCSLRIQ